MELELIEQNGIRVIILLTKHLDASNAKSFKDDVTQAIGDASRSVINLGRLEFVDSTGLGALLSCLRHVTSNQGALKLCCMSKPVRTLFELVRMHRVFEIYGTQDEALQSFVSNTTAPSGG